MCSGIPIYALTSQAGTIAKMALFRETFPIVMPRITENSERLVSVAVETLVQAGVVEKGDTVIITVGRLGEAGGTDSMRVVCVGQENKLS